ncbi:MULTISPECIES: ADP-ribosyltransferase domain-containing protein [Yersinia]|uniref:ADP-ribosyltransferase domain-containing protein n=1 Tax=Yersinia TaxID=629 RepID=UPI0013CE1C02|nr:ADP-ribosyltransferase domain-containing protein [Yersinia sp. IP36721]
MTISNINTSSSSPLMNLPTKNNLYKRIETLGQEVKKIKNELSTIKVQINEGKRAIRSNNILLKSLTGISNKHGDDVNVRLKNGSVKFGQGSNFLKNFVSGSRYQAERQEAAKYFGAEGCEVSAADGISKLNQKINIIKSALLGLEENKGLQEAKLEGVNDKKHRVDQQLQQIVAAEAKVRKADEANQKIRNDFSMVYQSNAGCKALNVEARYQFGQGRSPGSLSGSKVIAEYERVHGDNIFGRGNKNLKTTLKFNCSDLAQLVKTGAKAWYTPTSKNIITHRGQGITSAGINKLISQFNSDKTQNQTTTYSLGQFFSTSGDKKVAQDFANRSQDSERVMFEVKGNSGRGIFVSGGLAFENNEHEVLYSPLANFKVTSITQNNMGTYHVKLSEVEQNKKARLLPY